MRNLPELAGKKTGADASNGRNCYGLYERHPGNIGRTGGNPLASLTVEPVGKYEKAPEILSVKGSVIGTLGNFSASIGKAKSKKTFNVSAIVACGFEERHGAQVCG